VTADDDSSTRAGLLFELKSLLEPGKKTGWSDKLKFDFGSCDLQGDLNIIVWRSTEFRCSVCLRQLTNTESIISVDIKSVFFIKSAF